MKKGTGSDPINTNNLVDLGTNSDKQLNLLFAVYYDIFYHL